jgi:osmotically-inducible protein OsmY
MSNRIERDDDRDRRWRESEEERRRQSQGSRDRGVFDRAGDEVRSWFGDDEAQRRRRMDDSYPEREGERYRSGYEPVDRRDYRDIQSMRGSFSDYESESDRERNLGYRTQGYGGRVRGSLESGRRPNYSPYADSYGYTDLWMKPGPYIGWGPAGYQRSDERIREDICERLTLHGQIDARRIEVDVNKGEVTLRGRVDNRSAKRMAEETAESVSGVRDVQNQIRVLDQNQSWEQGNGEQPPQYGQHWENEAQPPDRTT